MHQNIARIARRALGLAMVAVLLGISTAPPAQATILVDQPSPFQNYFVGGSSWINFTAYLAAEPGGYTIGSIADAADVAGASSILVVERGFSDVLSAAEQANLTAALGAGKNVVLIGENSNWSTWDYSILAFAGGASAALTGDTSDTVTPLVANALTAGIGSINLQFAGITGGGSGGTPLFTKNFATLWGPNLLTVLDTNVFDDVYGNSQWEQNVADFLGAGSVVPAPEPGSLILLISGLVGLVATRLWRWRTS